MVYQSKERIKSMAKVMVTLEFDLSPNTKHFSDNLIIEALSESLEDKVVGLAKDNSVKVMNFSKT